MTGRILTALLIIALVATPVAAQMSLSATASDDQTFPEGLEGERFQMLIDALTTKNLTLAQEFYSGHLADEFAERFTEEMFLELYQWVASTSGGLSFYGVRTYDPPRPGTTSVVAQGRNYGAWWAVTFFYGDDPADGLTDLRITRARMPADVRAMKLSEGELAAELAGVLERVCAQGLFSGSVLIASGSDVTFQHACGEADRSAHTFIDPDTKFNVGSIGKTFTAVAVAQLVEGGALSYGDTLSKFVDESWLPAQITDQITIEHLLTHTSGLGDYFGAMLAEQSGKQYRSLGDYRELVAADSLRFEPGEDWLYSSTGYLLLGAVIESATGEDYFDYMREHIFGPAGMNDTGFHDPDDPAENAAVGYSSAPDSESGWETSPHGQFARGGPAGGAFSTARDLHRFTMALASGELISGETLESMWTSCEVSEEGYGYGFMLRMTPKGYVVGHEGGFPGVEGYYDIYVQTGHTVAVLTNLSGAAWPVDARIRDLMSRVE